MRHDTAQHQQVEMQIVIRRPMVVYRFCKCKYDYSRNGLSHGQILVLEFNFKNFLISSTILILFSGCYDSTVDSLDDREQSNVREITFDSKIDNSVEYKEELSINNLDEICPYLEPRDYSEAISTAEQLGGIISIGESHGNRNSFEFAEQLINHAILKGKHFVFLLEAPSDSQFIFDEVLSGKKTISAALNELPDSIFWNKNYDGRQSCAALRFLIKLNSLEPEGQISFHALKPTKVDYSSGRLKGHVMAYQALEAIKQHLPEKVEKTIVVITGRRFQRYDPSISISQQSSSCGILKESNIGKVTCIATVGKSLPKNENPCSEHETFRLVKSSELNDDFFMPFDLVLTSESRCSDYSPRVFD